ncbi:hypothetical protein SRIMM317S_03171 [Streptomyces rimosus subsp. rimosus]
MSEARGDCATVADRARRLERQVALLAEAAAAARTAEACAERLKEADAHLSDAAYRAGFDTPQAASDALLNDADWRDLQQRLDRYQAESAAVEAELADPEGIAAAALPPAEPDRARAELDAAGRRLRAAGAACAAAEERCAELDRLAAQAHTDARRLAPLRVEYERVARLAALAAGTSAENERRMRLESYVLAARLEQVAAAASARWHRMSSGRYTLVHSDERAGGARRSGLGLHVIDAWTGHERDTASLSGGETFFASLALALGLADVVTDEAGGTRLDTLSSTRASAAWTNRRWTRCWTSWTRCANGTAAWASSAMSRTCGSASPPSWRSSRTGPDRPYATAYRTEPGPRPLSG